jgi:hypothetical protein
MSASTRSVGCLALMLLQSVAATGTADTGKINAEFRDRPLHEVLGAVAAMSATPIEVEGNLPERRVSAVLHNATLQETLAKILQDLNCIVIHRTDGGVTILALDSSGARQSFGGNRPVPDVAVEELPVEPEEPVETEVPEEVEILPAEEGAEAGVTPTEVDDEPSAQPEESDADLLPSDEQ